MYWQKKKKKKKGGQVLFWWAPTTSTVIAFDKLHHHTSTQNRLFLSPSLSLSLLEPLAARDAPLEKEQAQTSCRHDKSTMVEEVQTDLRFLDGTDGSMATNRSIDVHARIL